MKIDKLWLTNNSGRIFFDLLISGFAAAVVCFIQWSSSGSFHAYLLAAPVLLFLGNLSLGIYGRYILGDAIFKSLLLATSTAFAVLSLGFLSGQYLPLVWWALICIVPLILPRYILNVNTKVQTGFVSKALKNRGPVVVVGGAGYIGTYVVEELLKNNYSVRVLDRLIYGKEPLQEFMKNPHFELIEGDATDILKLVQALDGASAVVQMAGLVGDPACAVDENFTRHANVISTRMVKEIALSFKVPRFIFASSCSVYGVSDDEVNEESNLNPVSLYAKTKIDSEKELLLCPDGDFNVTVLRFATVFGHSRRPRFDLVANLFTAQAMTDGKITVSGGDQWRPFIHVRDLAKAMVAVLKADPEKVRRQVFNVGDSRLNMTIGQLGSLVHELTGKERKVELVDIPFNADKRNYAVSFDKIKKTLGFEASQLMKDGIQEMVDHFKKGTYKSYKDPQYSNVQMTKVAAEVFHDPMQNARMYRPITDLTEVPNS